MRKYSSFVKEYKLEYDSKFGFRTSPLIEGESPDYKVPVRSCVTSDIYSYGYPTIDKYDVIVDLDNIAVPIEIADTFNYCCKYQMVDNSAANYSLTRFIRVRLTESTYQSHYKLYVEVLFDVISLELKKNEFIAYKTKECKLPLRFECKDDEYEDWLSYALFIYASVGILYNLFDVPYGEGIISSLTDKVTYERIERLLNWFFGETLPLSESIALLEWWEDAFNILENEKESSDIIKVLIRKWREKKEQTIIDCCYKFKLTRK